MSLLQSAIDAIELGIEDHASADTRRTASAARNLYAGVLLLLKEKLRLESPAASREALLYERIGAERDATGAVVLVGRGRTVDRIAIVERFGDLGLKLDKARLDRIARIRNEIEHHVTKFARKDVQAAIAATFVVVASVLQDHLGRKPSEVFSQKTWSTMLAEAETYKAISDGCRKTIEAILDVPSEAADALAIVACPECSSELMQAVGLKYYECEFECAVCGRRSELPDVIEPALSRTYAFEAYESVKDGGDPPIDRCPTCLVEAFSISADLCLACGESRPYDDCSVCGNALSLDEQDDDGMCGYCLHVMEKDD